MTLMEMLFLLYHANLRKAKLGFSIQKTAVDVEAPQLSNHLLRKIGICLLLARQETDQK